MNPLRYLFPKLSDRILISSLTNTAQTVVAAGVSTPIAWCVIGGGAASEVVIFRAVDNDPEYFRVGVPIESTIIVPGFQVDSAQGLEVVTTSAAADVTVTFFPFTA